MFCERPPCRIACDFFTSLKCDKRPNSALEDIDIYIYIYRPIYVYAGGGGKIKITMADNIYTIISHRYLGSDCTLT